MEDLNVNGTLIWYYYICKREVWLMARNIVPDQDNINIDIGRFIHETSFQRKRKEISIGNVKVDLIDKKGEYLMIGEIKKTSKFVESSRMQLAYYLLELKRHGLKGKGVLTFPKERKREIIELNDELIEELEKVEKDILRICYESYPPKPVKINMCKNCAYNEFCWS
ncbi:CRISPR-associated Cas4 family exonuclease [Keratinibaculum paraultunense]|uniref:CRISPR-associated exonuclease Cas4 n=1 Tax=Keratinibaculum paraultunense TaxID=1278232 RepID=A0A4R3L0Z6_9FIRM|nr:CRISPR-associated protein Cas4 [Keratinibaculum paraultunense]NLV76898.1 CRISPR-associated protein Cas4 [Tissierellia bacterium]QQY79998.1 CRISPR-associated protein Cas4 [Keratinibaculum paraultunense]TCS91678.1 CRISPR-associated Cas4 family exonuclease [Keratinibaculum paraultunense]